MDFDKYYKNIRKTDIYDILIEKRYEYEEFASFTSKGFIAVLYINDLFDNRYKVKDILPLFKKEDYKKLVRDIFEVRLNVAKNNNEPKKILWDKLRTTLQLTEHYNRKYVNDKNYFDTYYPVRKIKNI
jgi:hypothetical protein